MDGKRPAPTIVSTAPGAVLAPEPFPATYGEDVPEEMHQLIDDLCPQDIAETGKIIDCFTW